MSFILYSGIGDSRFFDFYKGGTKESTKSIAFVLKEMRKSWVRHPPGVKLQNYFFILFIMLSCGWVFVLIVFPLVLKREFITEHGIKVRSPATK
jgi:hypothetical protein